MQVVCTCHIHLYRVHGSLVLYLSGLLHVVGRYIADSVSSCGWQFVGAAILRGGPY